MKSSYKTLGLSAGYQLEQNLMDLSASSNQVHPNVFKSFLEDGVIVSWNRRSRLISGCARKFNYTSFPKLPPAPMMYESPWVSSAGIFPLTSSFSRVEVKWPTVDHKTVLPWESSKFSSQRTWSYTKTSPYTYQKVFMEKERPQTAEGYSFKIQKHCILYLCKDQTLGLMPKVSHIIAFSSYSDQPSRWSKWLFGKLVGPLLSLAGGFTAHWE